MFTVNTGQLWTVRAHAEPLQLCATLWTIAHQAPPSMGFSRQEYWRGLPCPPPGDPSNAGIKPRSFISPALAGEIFTTHATGKAHQMWSKCLSSADFGWMLNIILSDENYFHHFYEQRNGSIESPFTSRSGTWGSQPPQFPSKLSYTDHAPLMDHAAISLYNKKITYTEWRYKLLIL